MPRRSDKISLKKVESGKVLELWFNLSAKTELLKSSSTQPHLPSSSRNSVTTKETERKSRTSTTRETSLLNKSKRLPKLLKKSPWPRTLPAPSNKFWAPAFPSDALSINNHPRKLSLRSPEVKSKYDSLNLFKHSFPSFFFHYNLSILFHSIQILPCD